MVLPRLLCAACAVVPTYSGLAALGAGQQFWVGTGCALAAAAYFLPAIVAVLRNRRNWLAICALNTLLGWSVVGWVVAAVWAVSE